MFSRFLPNVKCGQWMMVSDDGRNKLFYGRWRGI